jgi:hypothetical protein
VSDVKKDKKKQKKKKKKKTNSQASGRKKFHQLKFFKIATYFFVLLIVLNFAVSQRTRQDSRKASYKQTVAGADMRRRRELHIDTIAQIENE